MKKHDIYHHIFIKCIINKIMMYKCLGCPLPLQLETLLTRLSSSCSFMVDGMTLFAGRFWEEKVVVLVSSSTTSMVDGLTLSVGRCWEEKVVLLVAG